MEEKQLYLALTNILQSTKKEIINWRLEGSANLFVQGIPIVPADLDITTNKDGLMKFEKALQRYSPKKVFNEKIKCDTLKCKIAEVEVEIIARDEQDQLMMLDKVRPILWSRLALPCLPLEHAKTFYSLIQRPEKVELIDNFLNQR
ncbi:MAG: hypothetical protein AABX11_02010 [Nanoarchaeota archaeon]